MLGQESYCIVDIISRKPIYKFSRIACLEIFTKNVSFPKPRYKHLGTKKMFVKHFDMK